MVANIGNRRCRRWVRIELGNILSIELQGKTIAKIWKCVLTFVLAKRRASKYVHLFFDKLH